MIAASGGKIYRSWRGVQVRNLMLFAPKNSLRKTQLDHLTREPRDAFKFVYALIQEHCANVPEERAEFKIPRPVLDTIRKQQVERMSGMLRGVRPA